MVAYLGVVALWILTIGAVFLLVMGLLAGRGMEAVITAVLAFVALAVAWASWASAAFNMGVLLGSLAVAAAILLIVIAGIAFIRSSRAKAEARNVPEEPSQES